MSTNKWGVSLLLAAGSTVMTQTQSDSWGEKGISKQIILMQGYAVHTKWSHMGPEEATEFP